MTRTFVTDPLVQPIVTALAAAVAQHGSVNALFRQLQESWSARGETPIYPNRLHALLSDDPTRAINPQTLNALQGAVESLPQGVEGGPARVAQLRTEALSSLDTIVRETGFGPASPETVTRVAETLSLPPAVIRFLLDGRIPAPSGVKAQTKHAEDLRRPAHPTPDWSFHDEAYASALASLRADPNRKTALVIPTGGGKTRLGVRVLLRILADDPRANAVVLWLTHRRYLARQARRELQRVLSAGTPDLPENAVQLLHDRVHVVMIGDLEARLTEFNDQIALVVVDEAHHAAAESYRPLFEHRPLRLLSLTATPVRTDSAPIGVDDIAYSTTYRNLFERGVLVEPRFEEPLTYRDWTNEDTLRDFADYVLSRARDEFVKTIIVTSRIDDVLAIYETLSVALERVISSEGHVLTLDDIGYAHGSGSSTGADPSDFLDEFVARPRGIILATASMLGEGFDDPLVNAVVITFPTTSMVQLMQVAGRCLRYAPGKTTAYIVQTRESELAYHFEQRWLYQDISDELRPQLLDCRYGSREQLRASVDAVLNDHRVDQEVCQAVLAKVDSLPIEKGFGLLLTGFTYSGPAREFSTQAEWSAVPITSDNRELFVRAFNDFSARALEVKFPTDFLRNYVTPDAARTSDWTLLRDMLHAMERAASEIHGGRYFGADARAYSPARGTTWLRYCTFAYEPSVPFSLQDFLADALNRERVVAQFSLSPRDWAACAKLPHPMGGQIAYLLSDVQLTWFEQSRDELATALQGVEVESALTQVDAWFSRLSTCPLPLNLGRRMDQFISSTAAAERLWTRSLESAIAPTNSAELRV